MWWRGRFDQKKSNEKDMALWMQANDVWQAHKEWIIAQRRLDYVIDPDEIDYAVYMWEAAEKRYEMLIRRAKAASMKKSEIYDHYDTNEESG